MKNQIFPRQFVLFLFAGGLAAAINFSSRIVYSRWLDFSLSIFLAYITGMISAFILAKIIVFKKGTQSRYRSVMWFTLVNVIAVIQTWIISLSLVNYLLPLFGVEVFMQEIAHAVGLIVPVFTSYIGHKRLSFQEAY